MKYRRNKVKREHGIIQNALRWLENLGRLSEVIDIIPGVIDVSHSSERGIVYKYETQTGCKLLLKSNGSIQEVFVVTKDPTRIQEWVKQEFPPDSSSSVGQMTSRAKQSIAKSELLNVPLNSNYEFKNKTSTPGFHHKKKRSYKKASIPNSSVRESTNVADYLDCSTVKALNHLKKSLEYAKTKNSKTKRETF